MEECLVWCLSVYDDLCPCGSRGLSGSCKDHPCRSKAIQGSDSATPKLTLIGRLSYRWFHRERRGDSILSLGWLALGLDPLYSYRCVVAVKPSIKTRSIS